MPLRPDICSTQEKQSTLRNNTHIHKAVLPENKLILIDLYNGIRKQSCLTGNIDKKFIYKHRIP